jgi:hypothetical protein
MNPRGPIPHAVATLDDGLFDAQCVADCAESMTEHIQEDLARFWRDRAIDLGEARHLADDLGRLQRLMTEQCSLLRAIRDAVYKVVGLVRGLRARLQQNRGEGQ